MGGPTIAGAGDRGAGPLPLERPLLPPNVTRIWAVPPIRSPWDPVTPRSWRSALAGSGSGLPAPAACPERPARRQRQEDDEAIRSALLAGLRFLLLSLGPLPAGRLAMPVTLARAWPLLVLAPRAGRPRVRLPAVARAGLGSGAWRRLQRRAGRRPRGGCRLGRHSRLRRRPGRGGCGGCGGSRRRQGRKARRQGRDRRASAGCGRGRARGRWARADGGRRRDTRARRQLRGRRRDTRSRRWLEGRFDGWFRRLCGRRRCRRQNRRRRRWQGRGVGAGTAGRARRCAGHPEGAYGNGERGENQVHDPEGDDQTGTLNVRQLVAGSSSGRGTSGGDRRREQGWMVQRGRRKLPGVSAPAERPPPSPPEARLVADHIPGRPAAGHAFEQHQPVGIERDVETRGAGGQLASGQRPLPPAV